MRPCKPWPKILAMDTTQPPSDERRPYVRPELKEFGTIAALTAATAVGGMPDAATMGNDKSVL